MIYYNLCVTDTNSEWQLESETEDGRKIESKV